MLRCPREIRATAPCGLLLPSGEYAAMSIFKSQFAVLAMLSACWSIDAQELRQLGNAEPLPPSPWAHHLVVHESRQLDVFIVSDDRRKPVVVMLPGSGCTPLFVHLPNKGYEDTSPYADLITTRRDRFHFAMIEKAGVEVLRFPPGLSATEMESMFARPNCTREYLNDVRLDTRSRDVAVAIEAIQREPWAGPVLLVGHSEGSHVVAYVAGHHREVNLTAVGLLASAGPTPFFAGYVASGPGVDHLKSLLDTMACSAKLPTILCIGDTPRVDGRHFGSTARH